MRSLPTRRAPGLDSIMSGVFQKCWSDIGPDVLEFVKEEFSLGSLHVQLNTSHIMLIPKLGDLSLITNYKPIPLLSTIYKIIAMVLTNRLVINLHKRICRG